MGVGWNSQVANDAFGSATFGQPTAAVPGGSALVCLTLDSRRSPIGAGTLDCEAMRLRISATCSEECGVQVTGELDTESRELIHRLRAPQGSENLVAEPETEVVPAHLVTFAPETSAWSAWSIECPLCHRQIEIARDLT